MELALINPGPDQGRRRALPALRLDRRRVPTDRAPATPGGHDERVVHPQRHHGRPADRGRALDFRSVETPGEVILPVCCRGWNKGVDSCVSGSTARMVFALNSLHVRHARQTLSKVVSPSRDAGVMWSYVSGVSLTASLVRQ